MGQKVHPIGFRLNKFLKWESEWYSKTKTTSSQLVYQTYKLKYLLILYFYKKDLLVHSFSSKYVENYTYINVSVVPTYKNYKYLIYKSIKIYLRKLGFRLKILKKIVLKGSNKQINFKIFKLYRKLKNLSSKFSKIPTDNSFNYLENFSKIFYITRRVKRLSKKRAKSLMRKYSISQNFCKLKQYKGISSSFSIFQNIPNNVLSVNNLIKSYYVSGAFLEGQAKNYNYRMWFYYFYIMSKTRLSSLLICYFLKKILENRSLKKKQRFFFNSLRRFLHIFKDCGFLDSAKGIKIQIKGRLGGRNRSSIYRIQLGSVTLSTISQKISYTFVPALTIHGSFGIKVWIALL